MKYETLKELNSEAFRGLTGIKRSTFENMISVLKEAHPEQKSLEQTLTVYQ